MNIEIAIYIALLIFAILAFFIIRTLLNLYVVLKQVDHLLQTLKPRLENFDPLLNSVANIGDICERKTKTLKENYVAAEEAVQLKKNIIVVDKKELGSEIAEWLALTFLISKNILGRK